ncbi:MAG: HlyC/CorC family transporter [Aeriscardovia sp.]|nr:HlyC/CorC family transporter [Aeriscardovia sp.]
MSIWLNILLILVFQLIGGVFSCTEMTLVSLRDSQIEQMEEDGDARGARIAKVAHNPNRFLSAVQIGTTFTGFLSASFGAASISPAVVPCLMRWGVGRAFASGLTTVLLTLVISYFAIVISELVPKRIAMQRTEQIARAVVPSIDMFATVCTPFIWLISTLTNLIVRVLGLDPNETGSQVSDDELRVLVSTNTQLDNEERSILDDVFDASETTVAEVMRPRADTVFLQGDESLAAASAAVHSQPYDRYPVIGEDFDDVLGYVHVRDLFDAADREGKSVRDVMRPVLSIPGTSKLLPTLSLMLSRNIHLAVVIDEYGGTDGIVTLMDMVEELIEDTGKTAFVNGVAAVDGGMTIEDFADLTGIELEDGPYETVAGYFLAHTGKMASEGDVWHSDDGYDMVVTKVDGRRIQTIEVRTAAAKTAEEAKAAKVAEEADGTGDAHGKGAAEAGAGARRGVTARGD